MEGIHGGGGWNTVMDTASHPMDDEAADLRRGPWTVEEDLALVNYISINGEGRWNSLARSAGLKRTGKSCRLRWLNYLRPDVRRGNITPEEQLLILELHSRWGNRWSKIAQHLPGRTDNEIKNYWRTRVQKHAKQLQCDVDSKQFKDVMRYLWMPRLLERIHAAAAAATGTSNSSASPPPAENITITQQQQQLQALVSLENSSMAAACCSNSTSDSTTTQVMMMIGGGGGGSSTTTPPVQVPVQQQVPAVHDHDHHGTSSSTLDWYGAGLLSSSSSETVQTTNLSPNHPPCGYYNPNNIQDCYFAPAAALPEFDHNQDGYLWSIDYDDQLWLLQQQEY